MFLLRFFCSFSKLLIFIRKITILRWRPTIRPLWQSPRPWVVLWFLASLEAVDEAKLLCRECEVEDEDCVVGTTLVTVVVSSLDKGLCWPCLLTLPFKSAVSFPWWELESFEDENFNASSFSNSSSTWLLVGLNYVNKKSRTSFSFSKRLKNVENGKERKLKGKSKQKAL